MTVLMPLTVAEQELERIDLSDSCRDFLVEVGNMTVPIAGLLQDMEYESDL
jgi:hypothetical protein